MMMPCEGRRSMMMLKVNQMFASANQEKMREKMLYYFTWFSNKTVCMMNFNTHYGLNVEEEHAQHAVTRFVEHEKVDQRID
jgi:hypothetical protein